MAPILHCFAIGAVLDLDVPDAGLLVPRSAFDIMAQFNESIQLVLLRYTFEILQDFLGCRIAEEMSAPSKSLEHYPLTSATSLGLSPM